MLEPRDAFTFVASRIWEPRRSLSLHRKINQSLAQLLVSNTHGLSRDIAFALLTCRFAVPMTLERAIFKTWANRLPPFFRLFTRID
jgi:hypothetical protein